MSKTAMTSQVEWKAINWATVDGAVFKLQKRIYRASQRGEVKHVRKLQKMLVKSWYAKLLAVRRVTQENKGKHTAGVDGVKTFDQIDHQKLLAKINTTLPFRRQIKAWLKAGVMDGNGFQAIESGTPQGGVVSPLLANAGLC